MALKRLFCSLVIKGTMFDEFRSNYPIPINKKIKVVIESESLGTGGSVTGVYDSLDNSGCQIMK